MLTFQVMSRNFERNLNNLQHTCLMVNQEKLVHLFLLNAKEVCCFLLQLAKLHILRYRELAGYCSIIRLLRTVDDDLLGGGNIGSDQDGGINLRSKSYLLSVIDIAATVVTDVYLQCRAASSHSHSFCWPEVRVGEIFK